MVAVVILAAGQGKRMISKTPKILHAIGGKSLVHHVIDAANHLEPSQVIVVVSPHLNADHVKGGRAVEIAIQSHPAGTGDALRAAMPLLKKADDVLILCGDVPLIEPAMLQALMVDRAKHRNDIFVVGMQSTDKAYGRLQLNQQGIIERIIEFKDATPDEKEITLCNSGIILAPAVVLEKVLPLLSNKNESGEYYLTDIIGLARTCGVLSRVFEGQADTLQGINNRLQLSAAEHVMQNRWRQTHMLNGVTMIDPSSVFLNHDTVIGADTILYPHVTFGEEVKIGGDVTIYPGCHITKTTIKSGAKVGPFAHLRGGTYLDAGAEVGNFVEAKNTHFGPKAKAKHLSYIGDAEIGAQANVGAGTITCNYNGFIKSKTIVGAGAFIGSNVSLVAPVCIGEGAIVAAGSVVQGDVPCNGLAIARPEKIIKNDWALAFRQRFSQKVSSLKNKE